MGWKPELHITCGRCGKPRTGLRHDCVSSSSRKATVRPKLSFGTCPTCKKPYGGNPLGHTCAPKSDFKQRKSRHEKQQRASTRRKRQGERHDYQGCTDQDCPRPLCTAFKAGWKLAYPEGFEDGFKLGYEPGYKDGYRDGYDKGFPDGIAACPLPHQG